MMQTKTYSIQGMTCGGCVSKVKKQLEGHAVIQAAEVGLNPAEAKISFNRAMELRELQTIVSQAGNYSIAEKELPQTKDFAELNEVSVSTYKPLILIVAFIVGVAVLAQYPFESFSWMLWMRHFMAGFFIVFSFFKLLNLKGFADSYRMYDIVAAKWFSWGYIYPFVELLLGVLYLVDFEPFWVNLSTAVILGISSIGVIKSNLNKNKIKCACLGDVFNLPMSTVTIIEDLTMVGMALIMLAVN
tara:strand:- start:3884 stop:4615 length:732 start_codon:yes stop_codon:yes gene_type:complete